MKRNITPQIGMRMNASRYMKENTSIPPRLPPIEAMMDNMTTSIRGKAINIST